MSAPTNDDGCGLNPPTPTLPPPPAKTDRTTPQVNVFNPSIDAQFHFGGTGHLLNPATLERLEKLVPGSAREIVDEVKKDSEHERQRDRQEAELQKSAQQLLFRVSMVASLFGLIGGLCAPSPEAQMWFAICGVGGGVALVAVPYLAAELARLARGLSDSAVKQISGDEKKGEMAKKD